MRLKQGDSIVVKTATAFNGSTEQPAIVNKVWGTGDTAEAPQGVNCMVLPDCGVPYCLTSVMVHERQPVSPVPNTHAWLPVAGD